MRAVSPALGEARLDCLQILLATQDLPPRKLDLLFGWAATLTPFRATTV